jgi:hypothetical protein
LNTDPWMPDSSQRVPRQRSHPASEDLIREQICSLNGSQLTHLTAEALGQYPTAFTPHLSEQL